MPLQCSEKGAHTLFLCLNVSLFFQCRVTVAERGSYQCEVQKVQANLDPHLLEEAHHGLAGAAPALIDIDHCAEPGRKQAAP